MMVLYDFDGNTINLKYDNSVVHERPKENTKCPTEEVVLVDEDMDVHNPSEKEELFDLFKQQQKTLQQQQMLQQQQYQQQKEFLKEMNIFLQQQRLTTGNIDKLLDLLANNVASFGTLTGSPGGSNSVKQERGPTNASVKTESNVKSEIIEVDGDNDDEIVEVQVTKEEPEIVDLEKTALSKEAIKRPEEVDPDFVRMPTAEEKRREEEITRLLNG